MTNPLIDPWSGFSTPMSIIEESPPENTYRWATVTDDSPLTIRLDGDTTALPLVPENLAGTLAVNDRVWAQLFGRRVLIVGRSGGARALPSLPLGKVARGETTSGTYQSASTTRVDIVTASAFTAVTGRRYKVTLQTQIYSSVTDDLSGISIREGSTELRAAGGFQVRSNDGICTLIYDYSPTAGSHTLKGSFWRQSGSGTCQVYVSSTEPTILLVEDIGLS